MFLSLKASSPKVDLLDTFDSEAPSTKNTTATFLFGSFSRTDFCLPSHPIVDLFKVDKMDSSFVLVSSSSVPTQANGTKAKPVRRAVPRQHSVKAIDPRNVTSDHPDQRDWSWENMPNIIYQMKPDANNTRSNDPGIKRYPIHGQFLRDLSILPDNISSVVEEFRVEAWVRLDRRVQLADIVARMHPDFRIAPNALQQRGVRFRQEFGLIAWNSGNKKTGEFEEGLAQKMRDLGRIIEENSTRGYTPGLINPALGEAGGRIPLPANWIDGSNGSRRKKSLSQSPSKALSSPALEEMPSLSPTGSSSPGLGSPSSSIADPVQPPSPGPEPEPEPEVFVHEDIPVHFLPREVCPRHVDLIKGITKPALRNPRHVPRAIEYEYKIRKRAGRRAVRKSLFHALCDKFGMNDSSSQITKLRPEPPVLQLPTEGLYPLSQPFELDETVPLEEQNEAFGHLLNQYYSGERTLVEMPYF